MRSYTDSRTKKIAEHTAAISAHFGIEPGALLTRSPETAAARQQFICALLSERIDTGTIQDVVNCSLSEIRAAQKHEGAVSNLLQPAADRREAQRPFRTWTAHNITNAIYDMTGVTALMLRTAPNKPVIERARQIFVLLSSVLLQHDDEALALVIGKRISLVPSIRTAAFKLYWSASDFSFKSECSAVLSRLGLTRSEFEQKLASSMQESGHEQ